MQLFNRQVSARKLAVFGFETMLISGSFFLAAVATGSLDDAAGRVWRILIITGLCELCFYYNDLYDLTTVRTRNALVVHLLHGVGSAAMALAVVSLLVPALIIGHGALVTALCVLIVAVPLWRLGFDHLTQTPPLEERVLILGTGPVASLVARAMSTQRDFAYRVVGFARGCEVNDDACEPDIGDLSDLPSIIAKHHIERVVVGLSDHRGALPIEALLSAKLSGVRVEDAATTYERVTGKILIESIRPSWLIFSDGFRASRATRLVKRILDLLLAVVGLIVSAPLMLVTALAVWLESGNPVLYRQERIGEGGRRFTLRKFRSMRVDAELGVPMWAGENDTRATRVGRFIRITRLDELPQLWNVVRGEMSFVGPRPERPFFVEQLAAVIPYYRQRHAVKPGITGWAQVKYRYGSSIEDATEKLRYDFYYIKHLSILFDLSILLDTVRVILSGKGAQ
jgi:sugar transferase (PEP-CTERM system associated)